MRRSLIALPVLLLALSASAGAVTVLDTSAAWAGTNFAAGLGNGTFTYLNIPTAATSTYGQTFVAPSDAVLGTYTSKFAFVSGSAFTYRLYISEWSDTDRVAVGTPVFTSPSLTSIASTVTGFQDVSVVVNTTLVPGKKYVAFYSTTRENVLVQGAMEYALADYNAYSDGGFVYNSTEYNQLFSDAWTTNYSPNDTVFRATFAAAVPEPAPMLGLGLGALALLRRRRK